MAKRLSTEGQDWVKANQGQHFCKCGCGGAIPVTIRHWQHGRRVPDYLKLHQPPHVRPAEERFWKKVDRSGECWLWLGAVSGSYGRFFAGAGRGVVQAHRFSWEVVRGAVPDGLFLCHHCDEPLCVNPSHLFPGTPAENVADMWGKGRGPCRAGELNQHAKLNAGQVLEIRRRRVEGVSLSEIAREFGLQSSAAVSEIVQRHRWQHVPDFPDDGLLGGG
jgi:hypothetical protein